MDAIKEKCFYGIRKCHQCNKIFIISNPKQRYAIQYQEAYNRKVFCIKCWKDMMNRKIT